uniref:replication factor A n=1 Tax=Salinigranum salinum TaxID=1364937 RepID=UPI0012611CF7
MSTTNNSEMEDRAVTIVETFEASEIPTLQGISPEQVDQKLQSLLTYQVPMAEAERVVVRSYLEDAELDRDDLPGPVADLAGFAPQPGHSFDRVMIETIDEDGMWCDLIAEVVELWEPRSESIAQVGLIGDESGVIKFVKWASAELPELEEGQTYTFQNVVSDEYEGRYSVGLNSATSVDPSDESINASDGTVEASGTIVDIQDGSGLIKRCPHEDCTRVLQNGRCAEHGQVDGEFDLRIKAILDDGSQAVNVIFDAEATTAVTGLSMEEAKQLAMDALSTDV